MLHLQVMVSRISKFVVVVSSSWVVGPKLSSVLFQKLFRRLSKTALMDF